jgi:hypothetical protein
MVGAGVPRGGTPAFDPGTPVSLRLLDTRRREGSNNVLLRNEVSG